MVFNNGILLPKLFRKKCSSDHEKLLKMLEITRRIYSNSERSEQFLVTECFSKRQPTSKEEDRFIFSENNHQCKKMVIVHRKKSDFHFYHKSEK